MSNFHPRPCRAARIRTTLVAAFIALTCGPMALPATAGGATWSSAGQISPTNQPDPTRGSQLNAVAVNAAGLTVAAWDQFTYSGNGGATIGLAVQLNGRWSPPFTVSGSVGFSTTPSVAVGLDGTMAVTWTYEDPVPTTVNPQRKIQVAVKPAMASSWTTATLAQGPIGGVDVIPLAPVGIDRNGNVTAAWTLWDGARHVVQTATLMAGALAWQPPLTLSAPGDDGLSLGLSVNARGDAAVAYSLSPYTAYASGTSARFVARSGPGGTWSAPVTVSETMSSSVGYITTPQVALDANGLATIVYMGYGIESVRQLPDGTWTPPRTVIAAPNAVSSYQGSDCAVDSAGNAVVAASIFDATVGVDRASIWVARGLPNGDWTVQQRITDPTVPIDAYTARAAISSDGTLIMVGWIDHYHGTVQVSKWTGSTWGAADTIGRGTAYSSFQEVLSLDIGSGAMARAIWKNAAKSGTRTMAASYR